jgi:hypothetical protein
MAILKKNNFTSKQQKHKNLLRICFLGERGWSITEDFICHWSHNIHCLYRSDIHTSRNELEVCWNFITIQRVMHDYLKVVDYR